MSLRTSATRGAQALCTGSLLTLGSLLAACGDTSAPSSPDLSAIEPRKSASVVYVPGLLPKQIVFGAATSTGDNIFRINPNGTGQVQVTQPSEGVWGVMPAWSPERTRIAYSRTSNGEPTVRAMKLDGTWSTWYGDGDNPRWSPDGTKIAYQRTVGGGPPQVYVINVLGTGRQQVGNHPHGSSLPTWSPDGTKIAYSAASDIGSSHSSEIWVMNADGTDPRRLTDCYTNGAKCVAPDWSPTAGDDRIVYSMSPYGKGSSQVRTIRANGTEDVTVRAVPNFAGNKSPVWSPDGTRIAYFDKPHHQLHAEVFTMKADGTSPQQLTSMNFPKLGLDW